MAELKKFQAQIGFEGQAQSGRFDPVQTGFDPSQRQRNQQIQQDNMQQVLQARLNAFKIEDRVKQSNLDALAQFSDTLWSAIETGGKAAVQAERNRGARIAAEQVQAEEKAYNSKVYSDVVRPGQLKADEAAKAAAKDGAPPLVVDQISALGGWARYEAELNKLSLLKDKVGAFLSNALVQAPPADEMDLRAKVEQNLELFDTVHNLGNFNPVLVNEVFLPSVEQAKTKVLTNYDLQFAAQRGDEKAAALERSLINNPYSGNDAVKFQPDVPFVINGLLSTLNSKTGNLYTLQEAQAKVQAALVNGRIAGFIPKEFFTLDPKNGGLASLKDNVTGQPLGIARKLFVSQIVKAVRAAEINEFQQQQGLRNAEAATFSQNVIEIWQERARSGNAPTAEEGANTIKEFNNQFPGASSEALNNWLSDYAQGERLQGTLELNIVRALQSGTATMDLLKGASPELKKKYESRIQQQVLTNKNAVVKTERAGLKGLVANSVIGPRVQMGMLTSEANSAVGLLQQNFDQRLEQLLQTPAYEGKPEAAARQVAAELATAFNAGLTDPKSPYYYDTKTKTMPGIRGSAATVLANKQRSGAELSRLQIYVRDAADPFSKSSEFSNVQEMYDNYTKFESIPIWFSALAKMKGLDPAVALNKVFTDAAKTNPNIKPIPNINQLTQNRSQLGPRVRQLFDQVRSGQASPIQLRTFGGPKSWETLPHWNLITQTTTPDTGPGYMIKELGNDANGRPLVLSPPALNAFYQMSKDSNGIVKASDIESAQRSLAKNKSLPGASPTSKHLKGLSIDAHGETRAWLIRNGERYGWYQHKYTDSSGRTVEWHFNYLGP